VGRPITENIFAYSVFGQCPQKITPSFGDIVIEQQAVPFD